MVTIQGKKVGNIGFGLMGMKSKATNLCVQLNADKNHQA